MSIHFNPFAITLLMSGVTTLFLGFLILQRLGGAAKWFGVVMSFIALWSITYSFELASGDLDQMLFWINMEYIGIATLPALWLVFTIKYTGNSRWLTLRNLILIFIFPVIGLALVWTNPYHHFHYEKVGIDNSGPFPLLAITPGFWYHIHTVYFYFLLALGNYLLIDHYKKADIIYRRQNISIVIASFIPWLINVVYLSGIRPFGHIDLTPYAFILTSLVIGIGLLRFNLFSIVPLAYEKVIASMNDGMLILDAYNRIIDANRGMMTVTATKERSMVGKYLEDILSDENELYLRIRNQFYGKFEYHFNNRLFEVDISHISDKNATHKGTLLVFRDITESHEARDLLLRQSLELSELNKTKDKIFSIISHDLRSPLASLSSMISMTREGNITAEEFKSFLPVMSENVDYTSGLIENLLHWSRSQLKGEKPRTELFDIKELIKREITYFEKSATAKEVTLRDETFDKTYVFADKDMIQLVLRNLISNAIKFCRKGDHVSITSQINAHEITICIDDTGIGMSDKTLEKLFGYETFTTRGTANEAGTGLGLMVCRDFIEKNNGKIWATSELEKGSRFCFSLPGSSGNKS